MASSDAATVAQGDWRTASGQRATCLTRRDAIDVMIDGQRLEPGGSFAHHLGIEREATL
jgi:hypothetical protein